MSVGADSCKSSPDSRVHTVGTGCLWLTICENQNESVKDRTSLWPLFIFPDIEDECRRASLQTISHPERKKAVNVGWVTAPTSLPTTKFWDGPLPKVNLIMCWLKFLQYDC